MPSRLRLSMSRHLVVAHRKSSHSGVFRFILIGGPNVAICGALPRIFSTFSPYWPTTDSFSLATVSCLHMMQILGSSP
eukprot:scaffold405_cov243-Pinguiococcus_pyrenoidosus.AAC.21